MAATYIVGTADTKETDLGYVRDLIAAQGLDTVLIDVGTTAHDSPGDVTPDQVAALHPDGSSAVFGDDRGAAVDAMSIALERYVVAHADDIAGIISAGGSGGTALATRAMRALPVGVPKVMVSTVASANVAPYVGPSDIMMMYSVADVAGLNRISRRVLGNAAHAMAGMVANPIPAADDSKPAIGLTMFGVTTDLVSQLADALADRYDPLVFHATGTGGQSMEKLVESGLIAAVLDMTTTEVADYLVGGVFPCLPTRFDVIADTGVPYVGSVGAVDMVNFGALDTVPDQFRDRLLHVHNPNVTLMRTTPDENRRIGGFIAEKLNRCDGPIRLLLPTGGVSMIDAPGQPFYDPDADEALFSAIEHGVDRTDRRVVERVDANINDRAFVQAVLARLADITGGASHGR